MDIPKITTAFLLIFPILTSSISQSEELLNVSYDPTRELYQEFNEAFKKHWKETNSGKITIRQSHGGSGKQARAVIDGLEADVVTLALAYDIDQIAATTSLIPSNWQSKLPHNSSPYTSTIVFLVRKGNPKQIKDWNDLIKPGVEVITPNPKTSGGARWNYLAAWAYAEDQFSNEQGKVIDFMKKLFRNVPVLDTGARGSTTTFVQREIGDILITWENEAFLALNELGQDNLEMVVPSSSILAEPPVTIVEKVAEKHGTLELAKSYLEFLYTPTGQEIAAKHYYRPIDNTVRSKYSSKYPNIRLITVQDRFGGWRKAQTTHFNDGGFFDQIYENLY